MLQAAQAGRTSRLLYEQATTLERIARQHLILEDNALLDEYARLREDFRQTTRQLAALPLEPGRRRRSTKLADRESRLHKLLTAPRRAPEAADASSPTAMRSSSTARSRCSPRATS